MKKRPVPSDLTSIRRPCSNCLGPIFGSLLFSTLATNAQVTLTFDDGLQGVVAGGDATSVVWDSVGKRLEINTVGGWKQSCAFLDLNSADPAIVPLRAELGLALTNGGTLSYDIIVETTSVTSTDPLNPVNPGWFETMYIGNSSAGWDQTYGSGKGQITAYGAFPLTAPILHTVNYTIEAASSVASDTIAQFGAASGWYQINFGLNSQPGTNVKYYIDNIKIDANEVVAPVIIPNLKITPAVPGLTIISSGVGQYDRQCVRTSQGLDVSWVGGTFPKTYEFTIADYPPNQGYESVIYFIPVPATPPGTEIPATNSNPDYSMPVAAGAWIYPNGDGTGSLNFRYKVGPAQSNGPAGNEFWVGDPAPSHGLGGQLASVFSTKFLGTWKVTFTSDTDFTLTAPDGATATASFNPTAAALFAGPMHVYFGNVPSQAANIGLAATYSHIKITGTVNPVDEELSVNPYSGDLEVAASVPTAVVQVLPDNAKFWLSWTMPATDFQPMQSMDLGVSDPWVALPSGPTHNSKFGRTRLLLETELSSPTRNFIRLVRPGTP